jgi:hypothetical protein
MMSSSEIADFRKRQDEQEAAAQQGLNGLAYVGSHAEINARQENGAEYLLVLIQSGRLEEAEELAESNEFWKRMGNK